MKVRIKFSKYGPVRFLGHLDVMRYFQKALRRADIDVAYSGGFSPHQIMSFAAPLSVGHTSSGEYFDIEIHTFTSEKELQEQLQEVMVEGFDILEVQLLPEKEKNAMAGVAAADYLVSFSDRVSLPTDWKDRLMEFYGQEKIPVTKTTKKGQRQVDLKEGVYVLEVRGDAVYMLVDAGRGSNIKPGFVLETFFEKSGLTLPRHPFRIHRIETYRRKEDGHLAPLIS